MKNKPKGPFAEPVDWQRVVQQKDGAGLTKSRE